jgi:hypothetical protein
MIGEHMDKPEVIRCLGQRILERDPDPAVEYRLLRDLIRLPSDDVRILKSWERLKNSKWVKELEVEQWEDGSWGRLHSIDTKARQRIATTEWAVQRALALGLDRSHPILQRAAGHLANVLETGVCHDPPESNDRWQTGMSLISAATLARIDARHPALEKVILLWEEILRRTFASSVYDPQAELEAHRSMTGASVENSYLTIDNRYLLSLIGSCPRMLPEALINPYLSWLWNSEDGIGYLGIPMSSPPPKHPGKIERWFTSLELISRLPGWRRYARSAVQWLWNERSPSGYWDFGPRSSSNASVVLPLSEHWRRKGNREIDWTTCVLLLLVNFHDE